MVAEEPHAVTRRRLTAGEVHAAGIATIENALSVISDAVIGATIGRSARRGRSRGG